MTTPRTMPVTPSIDALATLAPLPLSAVTLTAGGHLGRWQHRNRTATLPHCLQMLEACGALENVRSAGGSSSAPFQGLWFADSDIYKILEAVLWQLAAARDEELETFVEECSALLAAAQDADGYLNSWFQLRSTDDRWSNLKWGHELYCLGHLIQAAVAGARVDRAPELVAVARRAADLVVGRYGPDAADGACGHPEIETALVELFRLTGHRPYLDTAAKMIDVRGRGLVMTDNRWLGVGDDRFTAAYFQDHEPVRTARVATGHAVRQLYLECGVVDVAVETGDRALLAASEAVWEDLFGTKTYITGAHGSRHRDESIGDAFELPPDRAYAETCAAIASLHWNWRLLLATGRARYAEEIERVLHNAIAVATSEDGRHFFYSNPLQLRGGHDGTDEDAPSQRLHWYACSCCPPNLARLLATLNGYAVTTDLHGVQLHLLTALDAEVVVASGPVDLQVRTGYPWDGELTVTVERSRSAQPWTLSIRVPQWVSGPVAVDVDGVSITAEPDDGYLRIERIWRSGERLRLQLPLAARAVAAHPHVDAVRGCVAFARGPLVYCLEQSDLPEGVVLDDLGVRSDLSVREAEPTADGRVDLLVECVATVPDHGGLYRSAGGDAAPGTDVTVRARPYFTWGNGGETAMRVWVPVAVGSRS